MGGVSFIACLLRYPHALQLIQGFEHYRPVRRLQGQRLAVLRDALRPLSSGIE